MKPMPWITALGTALLVARVAGAQPTGACPTRDEVERELRALRGADESLRYGRDLRVRRCEAEALRALESIPEAERSPEAHAQIGGAHQALGDWAQAEASMRRAMAAREDPWIAPRFDRMERAYEEIMRHVGRLELLGGAQGAEVRINGELRGRLPLADALVVVAGTHTLQATAEHYFPVQIQVVVVANRTSRESLAMRRVDEVPRVVVPLPVTTAAPEEPRTVPRPSAPRPRVEPPARLSPWFWATGAGAVVFGATAVAGFVVTADAASEFDGSCFDPALRPLATQTEACRGLASRHDLGLAVGIGGAVLGGLSLGAAIWTGVAHATRGRAQALQCAPAGPASVSCAWRF